MTPHTQTTPHTPGPWTYIRDGDYWEIRPVLDGKDNHEGNEADYKLIAAAPDLLAACQAFLEACEPPLRVLNLPAACKLARAALARANA